MVQGPVEALQELEQTGGRVASSPGLPATPRQVRLLFYRQGYVSGRELNQEPLV